jgi:hypothetical protein
MKSKIARDQYVLHCGQQLIRDGCVARPSEARGKKPAKAGFFIFGVDSTVETSTQFGDFKSTPSSHSPTPLSQDALRPAVRSVHILVES